MAGNVGSAWPHSCLPPTGLPNVLSLPVPQVARFPVFLQVGHKGLLLEIKVFLKGKDVLADRQGIGSCQFHINSSVAEEQQTQLKGWAGVGRLLLLNSAYFHHGVSHENSICRVFHKASLL